MIKNLYRLIYENLKRSQLIQILQYRQVLLQDLQQ
jgi:hypothetical protein